MCTLTSENVTSNAFASLNGLSVSLIDSVPVVLDVPPLPGGAGVALAPVEFDVGAVGGRRDPNWQW